jgi:hypothetical protein
MTVCLTLPALLCLKTAANRRRRLELHGLLPGMLLPLMWVAGLGISRGLRAAFPGPMERAMFARPEVGVLTALPPEESWAERFYLTGELPCATRWPYPDSLPVLEEAKIFAASWQRPGESQWSEWKPASGDIYKGSDTAGGIERLRLESFHFTREGLRGVEHLDFRLRALVRLVKKETLELRPTPGSHMTGYGWTFDTDPQPEDRNHWHYERERLAFGMSVGAMIDSQVNYHSRGNYLPEWTSSAVSDRGGSYWLPGNHYASRRWSEMRMGRDWEERPRNAAEPVSLVLYELEECLHELRVNGVKVGVSAPVEKRDSPRQTIPVRVDNETGEPFRYRRSTIVWPPDQALAVPAADAELQVATYFFHWLKGQKKLPDSGGIGSLVAAWWSQCLQIAALDRLPRNNALLQALVAGLPEEHRGELIALLPTAFWLAPVVKQRGWSAEAKPFVLQLLHLTKEIPPELMPLCRSYHDPAFNDWMRRTFTLDVPTVLYWESMPELAKELHKHVVRWSKSWGWSEEEREALLTVGEMPYLEALLNALRDRRNKPTAALYLSQSVLGSDGESPPPTGLKLTRDGKPMWFEVPQQVSPEFLQWFAGLTAKDFTFDRARHRFVRNPSAPKVP